MVLNLKDREQAQPFIRADLLPEGVDSKQLLRLLPYMSEEEKAELDEVLRPRKGEIDWMPLPGPQTKAYFSDANLLLYGGAAGGGKTDLLLGKAYYRHHRSAIFRREYSNLTAIMDRANELFTGYGDYNGFFRRWAFNDRSGHLLEYGAADNVGTERKFQGRAHDFKGFDEGPQFTYAQFNYLRGWNRRASTTPTYQLLQTAVACNPPQSSDERWITVPWAAWLDKTKYPQPAAPGELLYFISVDGNFILVDGPGKHKFKNGGHLALSHTFIPSSLKDNPYLDDGQYESVLQSLPEPLRSRLLFGDFQAGVSDDPFQLFPTVWVEAACQRWQQEFGGKPPLTMSISQLGVDVARGGPDRTVLSPRWGRFYGTQHVHKGMTTKDGMKVAALILPLTAEHTVVVVDAIGIGASPVDWLRSQNVKTVAHIASGASENTDRSGYLHFANKRAEVAWKFREALDPQNKMGLAIPPDPELIAELCAYTFMVRANGIQLCPNEDIVKRLGRSPDKAVSLILAGLPTVQIVPGMMFVGDSSAGESSAISEHDGGSEAGSPDAPWNMGQYQ